MLPLLNICLTTMWRLLFLVTTQFKTIWGYSERENGVQIWSKNVNVITKVFTDHSPRISNRDLNHYNEMVRNMGDNSGMKLPEARNTTTCDCGWVLIELFFGEVCIFTNECGQDCRQACCDGLYEGCGVTTTIPVTTTAASLCECGWELQHLSFGGVCIYVDGCANCEQTCCEGCGDPSGYLTFTLFNTVRITHHVRNFLARKVLERLLDGTELDSKRLLGLFGHLNGS